jgi:hypothetical protein
MGFWCRFGLHVQRKTPGGVVNQLYCLRCPARWLVMTKKIGRDWTEIVERIQ